jgi:lipoprotein-anchoring transpeptidase ErfK/SrfK
LFFYKDGELIVESDFVSGNVSKNFATPVGTYPIQYKENDAVLVGEDYETPVKYWMPFNRNIGMHDASWRKEFGKNIYMTRGSHGCINMPPKAAKKVFENIKRGVAVVVYELPGTESYDVEKAKETIKKKAE